MKVYEIVSVGTMGLQHTGIIFFDKSDAEAEAKNMSQTVDENGYTSTLNYEVSELSIKGKSKKRPTVYIDMDDTAVNHLAQRRRYNLMYPKYQYPQSIIGFFSSMEPMPGFLAAWDKLKNHYDLRFLTRPSVYNLNSYTEKAVWIRDNMGGVAALELLNINPDKSIVGEDGDYLIDDFDIHGQLEFKGEFLHFGREDRCRTWESVTEYLLEKIK